MHVYSILECVHKEDEIFAIYITLELPHPSQLDFTLCMKVLHL